MKFSISRFDPEKHSGFVLSEVRRAAHKFPYALPGVDAYLMEGVLLGQAKRAIAANPRGALIAHDDQDPDSYFGFVISPGPVRVTFAYTKYALRHMGVLSSLLEALCLDPSAPLAVGIWSPAASRIAAKGWRIFPEVIEPQPINEKEHERESTIKSSG